MALALALALLSSVFAAKRQVNFFRALTRQPGRSNVSLSACG
jgi:hypothetical protein